MQYDPQKLCRCETPYSVNTEYGSNYFINLEKGFVRHHDGQADLTAEQVEMIRETVEEIMRGEDKSLDFSVQYLTADSANSALRATVLRVPEELAALTDLASMEECANYDENFFKKNNLIAILVREGSLSIEHTVTDVIRKGDGSLMVLIDSDVPVMLLPATKESYILVRIDSADLPNYGEVPITVGLYDRMTFDYESMMELYRPNEDYTVKTEGFQNTDEAEMADERAVIERAALECEREYVAAYVAYDKKSETWCVSFLEEGKDSAYENVYIGADGVTKAIVYWKSAE